MITINAPAGYKILELGCGSARNPATTVGVDFRPGPGVDFTADLTKPDWPIASAEFDAVLAVFVLEHIPYPLVPQFLAECRRVLKPDGRLIVIVPNTEAQLKWILVHPDGWDGKDLFTSASCKLFGDQEHGKRQGDDNPGVDSHKAYFSPAIAVQLFNAAGFEQVVTSPYGERATDLAIEATRPMEDKREATVEIPDLGEVKSTWERKLVGVTQEGNLVEQTKAGLVIIESMKIPAAPYEPAKIFNRQYFDFGGPGYPHGYLDGPHNELVARQVLQRHPKSVLELGCGRGYVLKRLQDVGLFAMGLDVSRHCSLTRVCGELWEFDVCSTPWELRSRSTNDPDVGFDLCLSVAFFEHVPEDRLPDLIAEMRRVCQRGLHGISFAANGHDPTQVTIRPRSWWKERLPEGHEVLDINELRSGKLPPEYWRSAGDQVKLNLGCHLTAFAHGWTNIDALDLSKYMQANGYTFQQRDLRQGLIQKTGMVDAVFLHHCLEHFDYSEGLSLLRDIRRVLRPETGCLRVVVPNAEFLQRCYTRPSEELMPQLKDFDEMNGGCAAAKTPMAKLHALLQGGDHRAFYDAETLQGMLAEAGFESCQTEFRRASFNRTGLHDMLKEVIEMDYGGTSLFVDAIPRVG
jgi:predicted SAM-dependent methyltransferase